MHAIELRQVSKRYHLGTGAGPQWTFKDDISATIRRLTGRKDTRADRELWALKDVSFAIEEGTSVGIIGRNGAGKSTSLKIISRITLPTEGRAIVRGRVGALLEVGTGFHPELTGRENVYLNGAIFGMAKAEIRRKFDQIVAFAELDRFIDTPLKRYSSGMHMRLAFSVAAHLEPEVMLVDEVLAVGDEDFQNKCLGRISEIGSEGRTVLFISHNIAAVRRLCKRGILLHGGTVAADGDLDSVIEEYHRQLSEDVSPESASATGQAAQLVEWSVGDESGLRTIRAGDAATFRFVVATDAVLPRAYLHMKVVSPTGITVFAVTSVDVLGSFSRIEPGQFVVSFKAPALPVTPGSYNLEFSLLERDSGPVDSWHLQSAVRVVSPDGSESQGAGGLIAIPFEASVVQQSGS